MYYVYIYIYFNLLAFFNKLSFSSIFHKDYTEIRLADTLVFSDVLIVSIMLGNDCVGLEKRDDTNCAVQLNNPRGWHPSSVVASFVVTRAW